MSIPIVYYILLDNELTPHTLDDVAEFSNQLHRLGRGHRQIVTIKLSDYMKLSEDEKIRGMI